MKGNPPFRMAGNGMETVGILDEIHALVSDNLQVVSYKWLSRKFSVSSDSAKRLLLEFVENNGNDIEVVYTVSGWSRNSPSTYHIKLVSAPNLAEAKKEFADECSVQVYSVQACIPKDPVALWNAEFVQAEELFRQPLSADNCLLDNRFCGVTNPFVKRNDSGTYPNTTAAPKVKISSSGLGKSNSYAQMQPEPKRVPLPSPSASVPCSNVVDAKSESHSTSASEKGNNADHEKTQLPAAKKAVQSEKNSKSGGALANMWSRVSTKPKVDNVSDATTNVTPVGDLAQTCAPDVVEDRSSDDDDDQQVSVKRTANGEGNRKRRVIFDYSDEEDLEDAVNLASPDPPKKKTILGSKQTSSTQDLEKQVVKKAKQAGSKNDKQEREALPTSEQRKSELSSSELISEHATLNNATIKDDSANASPPKRRKVLKTRIDDRGREVTEVVWEGEDAETKLDSNSVKKADNNPVNGTGDRPPTAKKSPALGNIAPVNQAGKAGNKKAGNKNPKQGNILSFFKKV